MTPAKVVKMLSRGQSILAKHSRVAKRQKVKKTIIFSKQDAIVYRSRIMKQWL